MIHPHHLVDLERIARLGAMTGPMLMLGAQGSTVDGCPTAKDVFARSLDGYEELDLDGGAVRIDLNQDHDDLQQVYGSVFNYGTIEHVWNQHHAWVNAMRAVRVGGHFLSHGPANGWVNHGLHATNPEAIAAFVGKNGFTVLDRWFSKWRQQGEILWLVARKDRHIAAAADYEPAWQVYEDGRKKAVR